MTDILPVLEISTCFFLLQHQKIFLVITVTIPENVLKSSCSAFHSPAQVHSKLLLNRLEHRHGLGLFKKL